MSKRWFPTSRLRFVERPVLVRKEGPYEIMSSVRILQQMWQHYDMAINGCTEWRDVPIEAENTVPDAGVSPDA